MDMKMDSPISSPASSDSSSSTSSSSTLVSEHSDSDFEASCTSASGSDTSSRVHAASLVDPARHSPELLQLLDTEVSPHVIEYIVDLVSTTVAFALPSSCPAPSAQSKRAFASFVRTLHSRAEVALPTVLAALVYVARARSHLSLSPQSPYALERTWLGALITASKYTQDSTLKNMHWALCTGVFGVGDVGRIEREFLEVLDWELGVREGEVVRVAEALSAFEGATEREEERVPRGRTGKPSARAPVPALEPSTSSPASSAASASPRMPASASASPSSAPYVASVKYPATPASQHPTLSHSPKPTRAFKLHALLRAAASHVRVHVHRPHYAHEQPRMVAVY
ncbi:hypothetical protein FB451DRAFT_1095151 [Mycena latifolia]|nr:hypothetical protein FB451DRAFT_1095151 [Mycena latifolia]